MIFSLIRWIFVIIIFSVCYIFIKKSNLVNKRKWIILSIFMSVCLCVLSCIGPIENAFITFPTIESAYKYYYSNEGNIKLIVGGKESDLVIGQKDNDNTKLIAIMPKTNYGWKIGTGVDVNRVTSTITYDVSTDVYQYKNSDDYYIIIDSVKGCELEISDNRNSKFDCLSGNNKNNQSHYAYCSYVHCFDEDYVITVDGKPISFNNNQE